MTNITRYLQSGRPTKYAATNEYGYSRGNDEKFRHIRALTPALAWHITNWHLAIEALHTVELSPAAAKSSPRSCPFMPCNPPANHPAVFATRTTESVNVSAQPAPMHMCAQTVGGKAMRVGRVALARPSKLFWAFQPRSPATDVITICQDLSC